VNVTYYVYAAATGFQPAAGNNPVVPTTACGLIRWGSVTSYAAQSVMGQNWLIVDGLTPNTEYQFNVMAECGAACWAANPVKPWSQEAVGGEADVVAAAEEEEEASLAARRLREAAEEEEEEEGGEVQGRSSPAATLDAALGLGAQAPRVCDARRYKTSAGARRMAAATAAASAPGLGIPGYNTQRTAYAVTGASTGSVPEPPKTVIGVGAAIGIAAGGVAMVAAAAACFFYRRSKLRGGDYDYQYNQLEVPHAMDTISTPAYVRSGDGLFAGLRNVLRSPAAGGGGGGGGSINRSGLADSGFSDLEDRVAGYL
jgi:hypothetical protein